MIWQEDIIDFGHFLRLEKGLSDRTVEAKANWSLAHFGSALPSALPHGRPS